MAAPRLVADIGGTNTRFAMAGDDPRQLDAVASFPTADFGSFAEAFRHYLDRVGAPPVEEAAIAIATPVTGDVVSMTNHPWCFSIETTRLQLGLRRLLVLNDFAALAMSLPMLRPEELRQIGGGEPDPGGAKAAIGPGTGLGVSGLVPLGNGRWQALAGEGGHVTVAAAGAREAEILEVCRQMYEHVSAERVLSGAGLQNIYAAIRRLGSRPADALPAAEISGRGMRGDDADCAEALRIFCGLLGCVAGNLALTLGARGGLYIGGGIVPRLGDYFAASEFRARFEAKGRMQSYLAPIPAYVILAENPALRGAAAALLRS